MVYSYEKRSKWGKGEKQIKLLGQVEAGESMTHSPQIDGTVQRVLVKEGDRVTVTRRRNGIQCFS